MSRSRVSRRLSATMLKTLADLSRSGVPVLVACPGSCTSMGGLHLCMNIRSAPICGPHSFNTKTLAALRDRDLVVTADLPNAHRLQQSLPGLPTRDLECLMLTAEGQRVALLARLGMKPRTWKRPS